MKKILLSAMILAAGIFTNEAAAQEGEITVGTQFMLMAPTNVEDGTSLTGFNLFGKYGVTDNINIGLNIGMGFASTELSAFGISTSSSERLTPITVFGDYTFFEDEFRPFVGLDLGIYNYSGSVTSNLLGSPVEATFSENYFGFAPQAGAMYFFNDNLSANINLKYHIITGLEGEQSTLNYFGIHLGLGWTLD